MNIYGVNSSDIKDYLLNDVVQCNLKYDEHIS